VLIPMPISIVNLYILVPSIFIVLFFMTLFAYGGRFGSNIGQVDFKVKSLLGLTLLKEKSRCIWSALPYEKSFESGSIDQ
jgi:hypothetical protein